MFSGIVAGQGELIRIAPCSGGTRIRIRHGRLGQGVKVGDSVSVNGCCLTVVSNRTGVFEFDVLKETWRRTVLHLASVPQKVNLEMSLRIGDPVGGHFVTGHVDGIGRITKREKNGADVLLEIKPAKSFMKWVIKKGSVALDGVSLTVGRVVDGSASFSLWLIPHTLKLTTLGWKDVGDFVNLEGDMLAKYAQKARSKFGKK